MLYGFVKDGQIVLDEPLDLPDATKLEIYFEGGDLSEQQRRQIDEARAHVAAQGQTTNKTAVWGLLKVVRWAE